MQRMSDIDAGMFFAENETTPQDRFGERLRGTRSVVR
jgi:hypothetical protein